MLENQTVLWWNMQGGIAKLNSSIVLPEPDEAFNHLDAAFGRVSQ